MIKPFLSNLKYAIVLQPSPIIRASSEYKKDLYEYSVSADIKPTPQVIQSFKVPRTTITDIENNVVLIRSKQRRYQDAVPIPYSNHVLPPKPYKNAHKLRNMSPSMHGHDSSMRNTTSMSHRTAESLKSI